VGKSRLLLEPLPRWRLPGLASTGGVLAKATNAEPEEADSNEGAETTQLVSAICTAETETSPPTGERGGDRGDDGCTSLTKTCAVEDCAGMAQEEAIGTPTVTPTAAGTSPELVPDTGLALSWP